MRILAATAVALAVSLASCTPRPPSGRLTTADAATGPLVARTTPGFATELSTVERDVLADAESRALNFGQPGEAVTWVGDRATTKGAVIAQAPFRVGSSTCRRLDHTLTIASQTRTGRATACRRQNGSWTLLS